MINDCYHCKRPNMPVVVVGHIETGSGPGGSIYACLECKEYYGILPLEDHPDDTGGSPIETYPRGRQWAPTHHRPGSGG